MRPLFLVLLVVGFVAAFRWWIAAVVGDVVVFVARLPGSSCLADAREGASHR
jgi:uncharacterized membrane protein